jgi:hypothetical protein
MALFFTRTAA